MAESSFAGFTDEAVDFLIDLKANNNRQWFADNKPVYERALKRPAEAFCAAMAERLEALTGNLHRWKIYRIHRDVRFAKDKTPYNPYLHVSLLPDVSPAVAPAWIFGLETERLVVGACVFAFEKSVLDAYRERVAGPDGASLALLIERLEKAGVRFNEPELKRVPRGFAGDPTREALLRRKGLTGFIELNGPRAATDERLLDRCLDGYKKLKPLFDWLAELYSKRHR